MKILSIGNFSYGWDGSMCDEEHIAQALEGFGHEVQRLQREEPFPIYDLYDFILIAQWDGYGEHFIKSLKNSFMDAPVIYWAFDYQADGQEWHERLVKSADLYLSKRLADSKYPNWQWLSQDFAPDFLDKHPGDVEQNVDVLFTGSYLPWATERNETLKAVDEQFNLEIHSFTPDAWKEQGFKHVYGPSMDMELPRLVARAKVNLSFDHTIEAGYWSDRNAQIMCCGGFVLFKYVPLSRAIFRDNIAYFYDVNDCLENIRFYLDNVKIRVMTAEWGYKYAQEYLTVEDRVSDLLTIVESIL